jgi:hypothetical protein
MRFRQRVVPVVVSSFVTVKAMAAAAPTRLRNSGFGLRSPLASRRRMGEIDDVGGLEVYLEPVEVVGELFGDVVAPIGAGR